MARLLMFSFVLHLILVHFQSVDSYRLSTHNRAPIPSKIGRLNNVDYQRSTRLQFSFLEPAVTLPGRLPLQARNLGLRLLSCLDVSNFFFLPIQTRSFLSTFPVLVRIILGVLALDVLPSVFDVLFIRILWYKVIAYRPPNDQIDVSNLPKTYNVTSLGAFYRSKPRLVLSRFSEIARLGRTFLWGLFTDYRQKKTQEHEPLRALQFVELISTLGPAFIKFGQALSIRPDICSPVYLEQLIKLQDQVPPFSSEEALDIISYELGKKTGFAVTDVFARESDFHQPIAAASLGQVYRAELKGSGQAVAVKVQRPHMYDKPHDIPLTPYDTLFLIPHPLTLLL